MQSTFVSFVVQSNGIPGNRFGRVYHGEHGEREGCGGVSSQDNVVVRG